MNQNPSHYPPQHEPSRPPHQSSDSQCIRYPDDFKSIKTPTIVNQQLQATNSDKETFVEDVRSLLSATANIVEENVAEARKRLVAALDGGGKLFRDVEERAVEGAKCTDKALREHPYHAAAIAFGIGAMIGHLITHHKSPSQR